MKISKLNDWMQLLAAIGVLAGIFLVAQELQQNNVLAEAEMVNDIYKGWETVYRSEYETDIQDVFIKSIEQPDDLTQSEIMRVSAYLSTIMNVYQRQASMFFRYGLAYDPSGDFGFIAEYYFGGRFARAWLLENEDWLVTEPQMFEILSREIEARPVQTRYNYLERLRSRM